MPSTRVGFLLYCLLGVSICGAAGAALTADQIAVIVNDSDPSSIEIAEYYVERRNIPTENVVHIEIPTDKWTLASEIFRRVYAEVKAATPAHVQAFALTWVSPYRVDCMSITSAFAFGFAKRHCAKGCRATAPNPYFNSTSETPFSDYGMRPAMLVAGTTVENGRFLIDRGIQSDFTRPAAKAYLVVTKDKARNTRSPAFAVAQRRFSGIIPVTIVHTYAIRDKFDIMFYFTGTKKVRFLDRIGFLPGAMADHLTSFGGRLLHGQQMSALRWIEAGATGTYGTVVEPCNFPQKFPNPVIAMERYLGGETLIEAYWKSVVWPGQGIFIGEPLARPYAHENGVATADRVDGAGEQ